MENIITSYKFDRIRCLLAEKIIRARKEKNLTLNELCQLINDYFEIENSESEISTVASTISRIENDYTTNIELKLLYVISKILNIDLSELLKELPNKSKKFLQIQNDQKDCMAHLNTISIPNDFIRDVYKYLLPPQIVFCGNNASGKSSIINNIIKKTLLPVSNCTPEFDAIYVVSTTYKPYNLDSQKNAFVYDSNSFILEKIYFTNSTPKAALSSTEEIASFKDFKDSVLVIFDNSDILIDTTFVECNYHSKNLNIIYKNGTYFNLVFNLSHVNLDNEIQELVNNIYAITKAKNQDKLHYIMLDSNDILYKIFTIATHEDSSETKHNIEFNYQFKLKLLNQIKQLDFKRPGKNLEQILTNSVFTNMYSATTTNTKEIYQAVLGKQIGQTYQSFNTTYDLTCFYKDDLRTIQMLLSKWDTFFNQIKTEIDKFYDDISANTKAQVSQAITDSINKNFETINNTNILNVNKKTLEKFSDDIDSVIHDIYYKALIGEFNNLWNNYNNSDYEYFSRIIHYHIYENLEIFLPKKEIISEYISKINPKNKPREKTILKALNPQESKSYLQVWNDYFYESKNTIINELEDFKNRDQLLAKIYDNKEVTYLYLFINRTLKYLLKEGDF